MRLGGSTYRPRTPDELDALVETFEIYGLSAVTGPTGFETLTDDEAWSLGERAKTLGIVIGETHSRPNLMIQDRDERAARIENLRVGLRKSKLMGARSVCILVGTVGPEDHLAEPHPYMYTEDAKEEFRATLLRAVDGLDLGETRLLIEPWTNSFFYQPGAIREFLDRVGHPNIGLHLDLMNMVDQYHYYKTTELIDETFDLLSGYIGAVHFKDLLWDWRYMFLKFDEVPIGEGVIDYATYVRRVAELGIEDLTCFVEHFPAEGDYAISYARLHYLARQLGTEFVPVGSRS